MTPAPRTVALPLLLGAMALLVTLAVAGRGLALVPAQDWWQALHAPAATDMGQLLFHYAFLPRLLTGLLVGAGLAQAGTLMQLVLRNPAAEPATLGISAGCFLALSVASLLWPGLAGGGRVLAALAGGGLAAATVVALAWRSALAPQVVLLAGLMISLYASAVNTTLIMVDGGLIRLFIWGSGTLAMQDWGPVLRLAPMVLPVLLLALLLARPIALLTISDTLASGLGAHPWSIRLGALGLALWLAAVTTAEVGLIGFVGLAAPEILRRLGVRQARALLLLAPVLGALLLCGTDQLVQILPFPGEIPAGAATAMLGAPMLVWLVAQSGPRWRHAPPALTGTGTVLLRAQRNGRLLIVLALALAGVVLLSLLVGHGPEGWRFTGLSSPMATLFWRGPRLVAAAAGAILTALAGVIVQRLTRNPLASPELLGVSSGAAAGMVLAMFVPGMGLAATTGLSAAGAGLVLAGMLLLGRKSGFAPHDLFTVGIAVTTGLSAVISVLLSTGDPRLFDLLRWMNGSTFLARPQDAALLAVLAGTALAGMPLAVRWLTLLPLGAGTAGALGVPVARARGVLILVAALMVAVATTIIGPMSFVGLMAPHIARSLGARGALAELMAAALAAAGTMVFADWLGRVLIFPNQLPAGLLASLVAMPYLFLLMRRRPV